MRKFLVTSLFLLYFLATRPFVKILDFFGSMFGCGNRRRVGRKVQTPIIFLENAKSNREVILISIMHIGEADYYRKILSVIKKRHDHIILLEGIIRSSDEEKSKLTEEEKMRFDELRNSYGNIGKAASVTGLVRQMDALSELLENPDRDTRYSDIGEAALIKILVKERYPFKHFSGFVSRNMFEYCNEKVLSMIFMSVMFHVYSGNLTKFFWLKFSKEYRIFNKILLNVRNHIAFEEIKKEAEKRDVISIWGVSHIKGILSLLKSNGYEEKKRDWITNIS